MSNLPKQVKIVEVGPRDGLQNEKNPIAAQTKEELVNRLSACGMPNIEAASFVSPKWVPQMASGLEVMQTITRKPGVIYSVLAPNMRGLEDALAAQADEIVIFGAASEAFSQRNINCSIAESMQRFQEVAQATKSAGKRLRGSISVTLGCPYQGEVAIESVVDVVKRLRDMGCDEIDIADTIGVGTAERTKRVMEAAAREYPLAQLAGHFHDTYGQAIANVYASLEVGIGIFHSSIAGLGGCPYAKGATGNVATEDLVYLLNGLGITTGIDLNALVITGDWISTSIGRANSARAGKALLAKMASAESAAS